MTADSWFAASYVLLWIVVIVLSILVLALYRELGQLYMRASGVTRDGPKAGSSLQRVVTREGIVEMATGLHLVVVGLPDCDYCKALLPKLETFAREHRTWTTHLLMSLGRDEKLAQPEAWRTTPAIRQATIDNDETHRLRVRVSPFAIVVRDGVVVAKGVVNGERELLELAGVTATGGGG